MNIRINFNKSEKSFRYNSNQFSGKEYGMNNNDLNDLAADKKSEPKTVVKCCVCNKTMFNEQIFKHPSGGMSCKSCFVKTITPIRNTNKIKRNKECPCGSGKKYKKCCHAKEVDELNQEAFLEYNRKKAENQQESESEVAEKQ